MLISFDYLWHKYKINAKGVLHIGSHVAQECAAYYANGITQSVWIEAIPEVFERLKKHIAPYPNAIAINACISDVNDQEVVFNISNNDGQSSSFLEFGTHATVHPEVKFIKQVKMKTKRIDSLFGSLKDYGMVNIDSQGTELLVLKGMGTLLNDVNYAYIEINKAELYRGCPMVEDIDEYLLRFGFKRVETHWQGNTGWGDGFYIKNE